LAIKRLTPSVSILLDTSREENIAADPHAASMDELSFCLGR
jgi:hypothetical protein